MRLSLILCMLLASFYFQEVTLTAYTASVEECGKADGITASGTKATQGRAQSVKRACHCEPVRAAKQVPLGCRLAWQSVSKTHNSCTFLQIPG